MKLSGALAFLILLCISLLVIQTAFVKEGFLTLLPTTQMVLKDFDVLVSLSNTIIDAIQQKESVPNKEEVISVLQSTINSLTVFKQIYSSQPAQNHEVLLPTIHFLFNFRLNDLTELSKLLELTSIQLPDKFVYIPYLDDEAVQKSFLLKSIYIPMIVESLPISDEDKENIKSTILPSLRDLQTQYFQQTSDFEKVNIFGGADFLMFLFLLSLIENFNYQPTPEILSMIEQDVILQLERELQKQGRTLSPEEKKNREKFHITYDLLTSLQGINLSCTKACMK